ncbi:type II toxin-antitoxin system prevent-host-death family antitoxin [Nesterenkonia sp.]|uniref:type II toxin-antitoxin system Phd/YefM family antitoxin n=1 Tax=Nesterenkonia sp. TaxID=704201 RepID=UPI002617F572|nr:type II toxin-antitoxin system prevent-host-death family antitoxin [Nesterenkonia sp.]
MVGIQVNMHEAKSQLSSLVEKVVAGQKVTIARAGVPVADLVPHQDKQVVFGLGRGEQLPDPEVFDGPDEEINAMFYGQNP